jgi:hypothetical protein
VTEQRVAGTIGSVTTAMWEAKAAPGRVEDLVAFAVAHAAAGADVYRSADRVVVIDPSGAGLAEVPADLLAREPQCWPFDRVARTGERQQSSSDE